MQLKHEKERISKKKSMKIWMTPVHRLIFYKYSVKKLSLHVEVGAQLQLTNVVWNGP